MSMVEYHKKKSEPNLYYSNMDSLQKPTKYKKSNKELNYQHTYLNLTHK